MHCRRCWNGAPHRCISTPGTHHPHSPQRCQRRVHARPPSRGRPISWPLHAGPGFARSKELHRENACETRVSRHESIDVLTASGPTQLALACASGADLQGLRAYAEPAADRRRNWRDTVACFLQAGYLCIAQNVFVLPAHEHAVAAIGQDVSHASPEVIRPARLAHCSRAGSRRSATFGALHSQNHRLPQRYVAMLGQDTLPLGRGLYCPKTTRSTAW